jgi:hypothetical protein
MGADVGSTRNWQRRSNLRAGQENNDLVGVANAVMRLRPFYKALFFPALIMRLTVCRGRACRFSEMS